MDEKALSENAGFFSAWGLAPVSAVTEVINGAVNRVYQVQTPSGTFYLRVYKKTDPAIIQREHDLIRHVQQAEVPAIAPLFTKSGTTFLCQEQKYCALYPQALGHQVRKKELKVAHAQAAGRMLARIHQATASLPDVGYRKYALNWEASEWIARLDKVVSIIISRPHLTDQDQWALYRLKRQREWLRNPSCTHSYVAKYPSQVLHGDYHEANLFFSGTGQIQVTGVIDWDQAVYMPRAFELTRAAAYMFDFRSDEALEFYRAYLSLNPLSLEELEDGARAWGIHSDHYVWAVEEVYINNNERARFFIPETDFLPFDHHWQNLRGRLF